MYRFSQKITSSLAPKCRRHFSLSRQQAMEAKIITLNKKFKGFPNDENFKIVETTLPALKDGEFLAEAKYISVDPYARVYRVTVGQTMIGEQVAKILESKNPKYPVGEYVVGEFGWRTHTVADESPGAFFKFSPRILKDYGDLPKSLALGILGMPGNTALFGLLKICKPANGNTVIVSGAAGAVGMTVGQIAKIQGCRAVGITGSDEKGKRLVQEAGFDVYINYKDADFEQKLAENTADCYFDNVGGEISTSVMNKMNKFGRVAICGSISSYHGLSTAKAREVQTPARLQHLIMEGFIVTRWRNEWEQGIDQNLKWIREGRLKYFETITDGFENTPQAFVGQLGGNNFGKAIVKV